MFVPKGERDNEEEDIEDVEVELDTLDDTGYELVLPSGARVGHRSLVRYYRQSLNPDRSEKGSYLCIMSKG